MEGTTKIILHVPPPTFKFIQAPLPIIIIIHRSNTVSLASSKHIVSKSHQNDAEKTHHQWRRFHRVQEEGHVPPHFYKWLGTWVDAVNR